MRAGRRSIFIIIWTHKRMNLKVIILGALFFQYLLSALASFECSLYYTDPNGYIDDPNTLENGLFECGDPNLTTYNFTPPVLWERIPDPAANAECYAAIRSSFEPNGVNWGVPTPFEGDSFVLLSTEDIDGSLVDNLEKAIIQQKVFFYEGDVILGAYFFGTFDYPAFNDYCRIYATLDPNYACLLHDPNTFYGYEIAVNGGFDSDESWAMTGLWEISAGVATYNEELQTSVNSTLSQSVPLEPNETYLVSINVLTGLFGSGSDFFVVTLGDQTYMMTAYENTTLTQLFAPTSGNMLTISWANEGMINIDKVSVKRSVCPAEEFTILYKSVGKDANDINSYSSTGTWIPFEHVIEPNQVGPYSLRCEVADRVDTILNSYFAVDGLRICRSGRPIADLDWDCDVDLQDYSVISQAWLAFCPDPPFYDPNLHDPNDYPPPVTDPNIPCQLADIDNNWFVDPNDLIIMSDQWLLNASPK